MGLPAPTSLSLRRVPDAGSVNAESGTSCLFAKDSETSVSQ